MLTMLLVIAAILYVALQVEDRLRIPAPLGLIAGSLVAHQTLGAPRLTDDPERFAELVLFLLPILLISDAMELRLKDLRQHALSLFYLAVVAVAASVLVGLAVAVWLFPYLSAPAVIALFAMVLATDPVSVVSIFSKFALPHRLKLLAEGESLFNDATALIVYVFIGLYALGGGELSAGYVGKVSVLVGLGSVLVGLVAGAIGFALLKATENRVAEMIALIATGYGAFALAEHFADLLGWLGVHAHLHFSGILAVIVATIA
ncbi:MAG: sodium:proton antiporter, partial [Zetaproteobacteria bacterium]